jgi:AAA ATPase domain
VIGVSGSAGLGKSRLVHELTTIAADHNIDVFSAQSESHTGEVPFHVITTLLRAATEITGLDGAAARAKLRDRAQGAQPDDLALLDDLLGIGDPAVSSPIIEPDERRRRLTTLINAAVVARNSPAVYVIEDVHWIDEASESMLADFLAVVPQAHALVLITYRPEYPGTLGRPPSSQAISLEPLDDVEIEVLTAELLGAHPSVARLTVDIAHHAAGNPYFAQETVRELAEQGALTGGAGQYSCRAPIGALGVPATLQATIASRIDRLEPTAKRALGAASVIGSRFDRELLTLLDVEPALEELVESELIHPVSLPPQVQYSFRHPLIRTVAYESQLKSDRADMHRRAAEAIEARGTPDEDAALIAEHHEASGDLTAAYTWHMRAGTWSRNRDDHAAQMSWRRAERISRAAFERSGDVRAAELLSRALIGQGRPAEGEEILSRFDPDNMSERELVRWGVNRVAIMFWSLGAGEKANEIFALLRERLTEPDLKLILEALGAAMTVHENRIGDALVVAERVLSTAHAPAAAFEFAAFAAGLGLPLAGRGGEFEDIAERFRIQLDANDSMIRVMLRYCDVLAVAMSGDLQLAEERVSYYTDSTAGGALLPWVIAKMMTGLLAIHRGRMSEAISSIESGLDAGDLEASVPWRLVGRLLLARAYAALGNAAESRRVLEDAKEHTGSFVAIHDPALTISKSWLAAAEGSSRHAVELARAAADAARASGQYAVEAQALHDAARFGDPTVGKRLDELVHVVDGNVVAIQARHASALAAGDAQRLTAVSAEFERAGLLLSAADSAAQAASLYGGSGQRARSEEAGLHARSLAVECGGARTPAILGVTGAPD